MYICLCHGVTEKHIEDAIVNGARCMNDLRSLLRVTAKCGRCASCARACLQESIASNQSQYPKYALVEVS